MIACEGSCEATPDRTLRERSASGQGNWRMSDADQVCQQVRREPSRGLVGRLALGVLGVAILAFACLLHGQVAGATIQGTVTDSSGRIIPEAKVSIKNSATGVVTNVEDNDQGLYTAPNLVPGTYEVSCSAKSFATTVYGSVTLNVGAQQRLDFVLKPGVVNEVVVVQDLPPSVDLVSSTLSNVVNQTTVRELPLNGRDWTQLDDVVYDRQNRRVYVPGGEGYVSVFSQQDPDHYELIAKVPSAPGAKTALLVPDLNKLFVAVSPGETKAEAKVLVFEVAP
jgi:hypothetical protein